MSKHTKGKWEVSEKNGLQVITRDGETIAYTETCTGLEKDEANAQLISAAPELLEACKKALSIIEYLGEEHNTTAGEEEEKLLKQAIAKAEGEQNDL